MAEAIEQSLDTKIEANTRRMCRVARAVNTLEDRIVTLESQSAGEASAPINFLAAQEITNALVSKLTQEVEELKRQRHAEVVALRRKVEEQQLCNIKSSSCDVTISVYNECILVKTH